MAVEKTTKRSKELAKKVKETPASKAVSKKDVKSKKKTTKKKTSKKVKSEKPTKNPIKKFGRYTRDSYREVKRVTWPSRKESWRLTFAVISFSLAFTGLLVLVDYIFRNILERYIL